MKTKLNILSSLLLATVMTIIIAPSVEAIPAFARKNDVGCSNCHTAWPSLNATGRLFKENGYRLSRKEKPREKISEDLQWDANLPVSALIIGRPYDRKKSSATSNNKKIRALHEVEILVAGNLGKKVSGFFELEAEDEDVNARGWEIGIPAATMTYNHSKALNVQLSWAEVLWFDPYNTYAAGRRMTRGGNAVITKSFGGADNDGSLDAARQNITLYGRPTKKLFYGLAYSGVADDTEGVEAGTYTGRLAVNVSPNWMLGGFYMDGRKREISNAESATLNSDGTITITAASVSPTRNYTRTGIDVQGQIDNLTLTGAYVKAADDNSTATGEVKNDAFYVQALYVVKEGDRPLWAPLVRYDSYEKNNGADDYAEVVLGLNYYLTENIRGMVEYWKQIDVPTGGFKQNRLTFQVYAAF